MTKIEIENTKPYAGKYYQDEPLTGWKFGRMKFEPDQEASVSGDPEFFKRGFHASTDVLDALKFANGPFVAVVKLSGDVLREGNRGVATERRVVACMDAARVLHEFTLWCAEETLAQFSDPDPRSREALKVKRQWLAGKASDAELTTARVAASAAIQDAKQAVKQAKAEAERQAKVYKEKWNAARAEYGDAMSEVVLAGMQYTVEYMKDSNPLAERWHTAHAKAVAAKERMERQKTEAAKKMAILAAKQSAAEAAAEAATQEKIWKAAATVVHILTWSAASLTAQYTQESSKWTRKQNRVYLNKRRKVGHTLNKRLEDMLLEQMQA